MDRRTCHSDVGSFLRIHRSYIVNLERVVRIDPYGKDGRLAILCDGAGRFGAPAVPV